MLKNFRIAFFWEICNICPPGVTGKTYAQKLRVFYICNQKMYG